jgi:lactoylglutathione lyase
MPKASHIGRVMVPTKDQDAAIAWYTQKLGFTVAVDVPFGDGDRWVELAAPGGGAGIALVPPHGMETPRSTGIVLDSKDPVADHAELAGNGVDIDDVMGGDGTVPTMFFLRDQEGNSLMIVEEPPAAADAQAA